MDCAFVQPRSVSKDGEVQSLCVVQAEPVCEGLWQGAVGLRQLMLACSS